MVSPQFLRRDPILYTDVQKCVLTFILCSIWGAENTGVENAGAITRGNPPEEIP